MLMKKLVSFMLALLAVVTLQAQQRTVSGTVRDDKGDPIPYATIAETGTQNAAQANEKGSFSITINEKASLTISATGFLGQTVAIPGNNASVVLIRGEGQLQEVVITTLGGRRTRNQLAYSAQQVTGDEVNKARTSNFVQNLSGKIAGLELRQSNTLGGSTNVVL